VIVKLWDRIIQEGVAPAGLGARDTLRLEMGYALYGHELTDSINPLESVSAWTVRLKAHDFLGKDCLVQYQTNSKKRWQYGMMLTEQGIAREGALVFHKGQEIGKVTSGTFSPSLHKGIAIILVECQLQPGDPLEVQIRQKKVAAHLVKLPFWHNQKGK
jgi:aminomethyltransferase